jgi:hypothetical protein
MSSLFSPCDWVGSERFCCPYVRLAIGSVVPVFALRLGASCLARVASICLFSLLTAWHLAGCAMACLARVASTCLVSKCVGSSQNTSHQQQQQRRRRRPPSTHPPAPSLETCTPSTHPPTPSLETRTPTGGRAMHKGGLCALPRPFWSLPRGTHGEGCGPRPHP